ncbi:MAG: RecX family transcriptional regulator, partial [Bacteroidota bacterium]
KNRNIHNNLIKIALQDIDETDYLDTFNTLAEKKMQSLNSSTKNKQQKQRKLADYLLYRGWESHLVYEKIRELIK